MVSNLNNLITARNINLLPIYISEGSKQAKTVDIRNFSNVGRLKCTLDAYAIKDYESTMNLINDFTVSWYIPYSNSEDTFHASTHCPKCFAIQLLAEQGCIM